MIPAFERDKAGAGDSGGHAAALLDGLSDIAAPVHNQGRNFDFGEQFGDIKVTDGFEIVRCAFARRTTPLIAINCSDLAR